MLRWPLGAQGHTGPVRVPPVAVRPRPRAPTSGTRQPPLCLEARAARGRSRRHGVSFRAAPTGMTDRLPAPAVSLEGVMTPGGPTACEVNKARRKYLVSFPVTEDKAEPFSPADCVARHPKLRRAGCASDCSVSTQRGVCAPGRDRGEAREAPGMQNLGRCSHWGASADPAALCLGAAEL